MLVAALEGSSEVVGEVVAADMVAVSIAKVAIAVVGRGRIWMGEVGGMAGQAEVNND